MPKFSQIIIVCVFFGIVSAWDSDDLEIFDLVEEVGQSFYELLEVPENADGSVIKKAFRKLSLALHPDKNPSPDANIKFRQLVAVYDVLRDGTKRAKYDDVLINGLPDWKEAVYYYRKVRKMGLIEMSVILFIIITVGQYLVAWAAYFEKKYAIEEFVNLKSKKLQKKQKKGKAVDMETVQILPELVGALPKPTMACTLPVQLFRLSWFLIIDGPPMTYHYFKRLISDMLRKREQVQEEESSEEEVIVPARERGPRRRKGFQVPEVKESDRKPQDVNRNHTPKAKEEPKIISGGFWTDDDLADLMRLMKKFPQGTQERWEKIGDAMRRPVNEVAHMAHKLKDEAFKPISKQDEEKKEEEPKKVKTKGGKLGEDGDEGAWNQVQQKAFEMALAAYPKGTAGDRWEKISKLVPGKTKEECMLRYKSIVDLIKKKKEKGEPNEKITESS